MNITLTPKFLECLKNTFEDYITQGMMSDEISSIFEMYATKTITVASASALYTILKVRSANLKYVKKTQHKIFVKTVSKEHKYMRNFLDKYFNDNLFIEQVGVNFQMVGSVSFKDISNS